MEFKNQKPHAIVVAYPLQGHVIPCVHLAAKLASKGYTITFVNTESIHDQITKANQHPHTTKDDDIFAEARKSGLDIRYATVSDGFPLGFDRSLNHDQFMEGILHVLFAHVDELVGNIVHTTPPPTCLIADTFFVWPSMIAKKYNLLNVSFWTESALVLTLYYHLDLLKMHGHFACHDKREDTIDYVPGVEAIEPKDLTSYLQATDISTVVHRIIYKAIYEGVKEADIIICNTVQELEPKALSALQERQPVYAIGPIFPTRFQKSNLATSLWSESDCTQWLNKKHNGSVLYISFGSYAHCSKRDIAEIAQGLLLSHEVNFVWVLRPDIVSSDQTDFLPVGFNDLIRDKGLVVPWCCQVAVISHPAVGGFLTHCGWNSILESVWCNVPLLCFPLLTDQFTNRKLVVDDWRIGLNLCDKKPIAREEVAAKINRLMKGKSSDELRKNLKQVKGTLDDAVSSHGSSEQNFNEFIDDVNMKIQKMRNLSLNNVP